MNETVKIGKRIYPRHQVERLASQVGLDFDSEFEENKDFLSNALQALIPIGWHRQNSELHSIIHYFRQALASLPKDPTPQEDSQQIWPLSTEKELLFSLNEKTKKPESDEIQETTMFYEAMLEGWEVNPPGKIGESLEYLQVDPLEMLEKTKELSIENKLEVYWVARLAVMLPLPPLWKVIHDQFGNKYYSKNNQVVNYHPGTSFIKSLLKKNKKAYNTHKMQFLDEHFKYFTVDLVKLKLGCDYVVTRSEVASPTKVKEARLFRNKVQVEDVMDDSLIFEVIEDCGINVFEEPHLTGIVFEFMDQMQQKGLFEGWKFTYNFKGTKYWHHPLKRQSSKWFPYKDSLKDYLNKVKKASYSNCKDKVLKPSDRNKKFKVLGEEFYQETRSLAIKCVKEVIKKHSEVETQCLDLKSFSRKAKGINSKNKLLDTLFSCPFDLNSVSKSTSSKIEIETSLSLDISSDNSDKTQESPKKLGTNEESEEDAAERVKNELIQRIGGKTNQKTVNKRKISKEKGQNFFKKLKNINSKRKSSDSSSISPQKNLKRNGSRNYKKYPALQSLKELTQNKDSKKKKQGKDSPKETIGSRRTSESPMGSSRKQQDNQSPTRTPRKNQETLESTQAVFKNKHQDNQSPTKTPNKNLESPQSTQATSKTKQRDNQSPTRTLRKKQENLESAQTTSKTKKKTSGSPARPKNSSDSENSIKSLSPQNPLIRKNSKFEKFKLSKAQENSEWEKDIPETPRLKKRPSRLKNANRWAKELVDNYLVNKPSPYKEKAFNYKESTPNSKFLVPFLRKRISENLSASNSNQANQESSQKTKEPKLLQDTNHEKLPELQSSSNPAVETEGSITQQNFFKTFNHTPKQEPLKETTKEAHDESFHNRSSSLPGLMNYVPKDPPKLWFEKYLVYAEKPKNPKHARVQSSNLPFESSSRVYKREPEAPNKTIRQSKTSKRLRKDCNTLQRNYESEKKIQTFFPQIA